MSLGETEMTLILSKQPSTFYSVYIMILMHKKSGGCNNNNNIKVICNPYCIVLCSMQLIDTVNIIIIIGVQLCEAFCLFYMQVT